MSLLSKEHEIEPLLLSRLRRMMTRALSYLRGSLCQVGGAKMQAEESDILGRVCIRYCFSPHLLLVTTNLESSRRLANS